MDHSRDVKILREIAKKLAEISSKDIQEERRELWRRHNNLEHVRPPIYIRWGGWLDEVIKPQLQCEDPFYRRHEFFIRRMIFQDLIGDDYVIEPWISQTATYIHPKEGPWGIGSKWIDSGRDRGAARNIPAIQELDDINKMVVPTHKIDEEATYRNFSKLQEAVGDIIEVDLDRGCYWRIWSCDISTDLGYLRGIEQLMYDIKDNPEWLHKLLAFMRDGILKIHQEAEEQGDWYLVNHENQSIPYLKGFPDPKPNSPPVKRKNLWAFFAAQEFAYTSPEQHDEFLLQYQLPIMEKFGMIAYGCCEDLTRKINILRKIPNLRRIGVTPFADIEKCAEQIGKDYVISWRPSPSETVCTDFDPDRIRRIISDAMKIFRKYNCIVDICLKDAHTVQNQPERLIEFVKIVRSVVD